MTIPVAEKREPRQATFAVAIVLSLAAFSIIPVMDTIAKLLSDRFDTVQLTWGRYFFHLAFFLPFALWRHGQRVFRPTDRPLQIARGFMLMGSTALFFAALALIPMADALAIVFVYPFIVTLLSGTLLGERIGPWRWAAVAVGFLGVLIIIRPGMQAVSPGMLLALAAGCVFSLYVVTTRRLAGSAPPLVTLTYTGLIGAVVASAALPWFWVAPSPLEWVMLMAMGLIAATGHLLLIMSYEKAAASSLAPFGYFEMVSAAALGYIVFGDFPDLATWVGIAIVIASGLAIWWRETRSVTS